MKVIINQVSAVALAGILLGCATATPVQKAEIKAVQPIPIGAQPSAVQLHRIVTKLPVDEVLGESRSGIACEQNRPLVWRGGSINLSQQELLEIFRKELRDANYVVVGDPFALFDDREGLKADYLVGGVVDKLQVNTCAPERNPYRIKGGSFMSVLWQVYARREGKVVYETRTEGSYQTDEFGSEGVPFYLRNAFDANVRNLLADPAFRDLMLNKEGGKPMRSQPSGEKI